MRSSLFAQISSLVFAAALGFFLLAPAPADADVQKSERSGATIEVNFLYMLADFSGPVRSQWAKVDFDQHQQEIFTLAPGPNDVRIFNQQGMETYAFGSDGDIVPAVDIASGEEGRIYVLGRNFQRDAIQVLNFRGEPESRVEIRELPTKFSGFRPDRLEFQDGLIYLVDSRAGQIVVTGTDGTFKRGHDIAAEFERMAREQDPGKKKPASLDISGFSAGSDGSLYFTAGTLFSAFRLDPDGELSAFGTSGSGPGKFGIVSGIAADERGTIYVADKLRSVVLIFDRDLVFQGEFGYRGGRPEDMLVPDDVVLDPVGNRLFVSQAANKGVGVYSISLGE